MSGSGSSSLQGYIFLLNHKPVYQICKQSGIYGRGHCGSLCGDPSGCITVGQLSSFLSYANQYTKPFNEISGVVTELQNAIACAARIFELIEEEPQTPEPENAVTFKEVKGNVSGKRCVIFLCCRAGS